MILLRSAVLRFAGSLRLAASAGLVLALVPGTGQAAAAIKGTGGTFPAKVYLQWAEQYARDTGVPITYALSNSSVGVASIIARSVDFGATDVPLSAADLEKEKLVQFPTLVGGVVPVVNIPGLHGSLRLNAEVLAAVFAGQIGRWNDKAVAGTGFVPSPITTQARIAALLSSFRSSDGQLIPVTSPAGSAVNR